jgi:hypothetical protein
LLATGFFGYGFINASTYLYEELPPGEIKIAISVIMFFGFGVICFTLFYIINAIKIEVE